MYRPTPHTRAHAPAPTGHAVVARRVGRGRRARRVRRTAIWALILTLAAGAASATPRLATWLLGGPPTTASPAYELRAPALPDPGGPFPAGSAAAAQAEITAIAETFADCVHRASFPATGFTDAAPGSTSAAPAARAAAASTAPPYGACLRARALGLAPGDVARRGDHGPIDGRGARNALGVFTVHEEREAFLLKYDASATGWGFAFDEVGGVEAICRTPRGRECWHAEQERPGALFLGDLRTEQILGAVLRQGRSTG